MHIEKQLQGKHLEKWEKEEDIIAGRVILLPKPL